jgi:hypothetical protein
MAGVEASGDPPAAARFESEKNKAVKVSQVTYLERRDVCLFGILDAGRSRLEKALFRCLA